MEPGGRATLDSTSRTPNGCATPAHPVTHSTTSAVRNFVYEVWEGLFIALRAIRLHKLRSLLTTIGIVIGILSVTAMATVISGIEHNFEEDIAELGTDVLYVEKWPWVSGPGSKWWEFINRPRITADLAEVIEERSDYVMAAVPVVRTQRTVRYKSVTLSSIAIEGSTAQYPRVHFVNLDRGGFFNDFDERGARYVAVIGAGVAEQLFPVEEPIGKFIRVSGHRFRVIGVMVKRGSGAESSSSADQQIKIPYKTFQKLFGTRWRDVSVQVKIASPDLIAEATDELTGILRVARRLDAREKDNFEINEQKSLREALAPIKFAIYAIGIFLTALALVVGGIGVMNIMFVSIKERTKEIGLRKAVGAKRRTILIQFLIEAVIICLLGGAVGVLCSLPIAALIRLVLPAVVSPVVVAIAFAMCVLVGIIFGLAPAWSAAKAEPIEALRYE